MYTVQCSTNIAQMVFKRLPFDLCFRVDPYLPFRLRRSLQPDVTFQATKRNFQYLKRDNSLWIGTSPVLCGFPLRISEWICYSEYPDSNLRHKIIWKLILVGVGGCCLRLCRTAPSLRQSWLVLGLYKLWPGPLLQTWISFNSNKIKQLRPFKNGVKLKVSE